MLKRTRFVFSLLLASALTTTAQPAAAEKVQDCYDYVLKTCSDAMQDANFIERVAIGIICTSMLAGCTVK